MTGIAPTTTAPAATAPDSKATSTKQLNQNFDQFLMLLTTQLKNQDPLSPMDSTQFTNQLVSFSGVEQQIKMNSNLEKMLAMSSASQTTLGLSYIGLNVDTLGSDFKYFGTGYVKTAYTLPSNAAVTKVSIVDQNGHVVYSQDGESSAGKHDFVWDGKDEYGQDVPPGKYSLRVGAVDQDQKTLTVTTTVPGRVEGIEGTESGIMLLINDEQVPMSDVRRATL
jgi:flagellar basal-body rod modification protein FlgD